jgi:hypothetical protein
LDPEAQRIAGELVKLHRDGAIKSEQDAEFYASVLKVFDATYEATTAPAIPERIVGGLSPEQLVSEPPPGLSARERMEFYQADLADAIGEEYIDHDYQPPAVHTRSSSPTKKRRKGR